MVYKRIPRHGGREIIESNYIISHSQSLSQTKKEKRQWVLT